MAELNMATAEFLAQSLVTIGHPMRGDAIHATAIDLSRWCKGAFLGGVPWSPEDQARWLVDEVRIGPNAWTNWQDAGGTAALHRLFLAQFPPPAKPVAPPPTIAELVARGSLAPPCQLCPPDAEFCDYGGFRAHRRIEAELLARSAPPGPAPRPAPKPLADLDLEKMLAAGEAAWEEEQRRKREQLKRLEEDEPKAGGRVN